MSGSSPSSELPAGTDTTPAAPAPAPAAPYYSLSNIVASAPTVDPSTLGAISASVAANPCFRSSFLWGAALGGAFALHRLKQRGSPLRAANDGVLAGMGTFGLQWYLCRAAEVDRKAALKAYYLRERRGGDASPGVAGVAGEEEEAWRRDLRRSTQYHGLPVVETPAAPAPTR